MTDHPRHDAPPDLPPPPNPARRDLVGSLAALALLMTACGGGDDYSPPPPAASPPPPSPAPPPPPPPAPPPPPSLTCGATAISANHGHTLTIPAADVTSTTMKTYSIAGTSGHDHTITLIPAQLAQIGAGTAVTVNSTTDLAHFHEVTVNCS